MDTANIKNLDYEGLAHLLNKFMVRAIKGMGLSQDNFTEILRAKLDGIEEGANKYILPAASGSQLGGVTVGDNLSVDVSGKLSGKDSYTKTETNSLLEGKVSKVDGKGLSSEDFTAELKAMLLAAPKPDVVADLATRMEGLEAIINNSGQEDNDAIINKLNEVFAFLSGVSEDAKLSAILSGKVDNVEGKQLSTEDYTTADKQKLAGISAGANNYTLPKATESQLGGVKVGANLTVDSEGKISGKDSYTKTETNTLLGDKVSKETGKQLSTEDFTTELKNRLLALTNYNDAALTAEIAALKTRLDVLVGSGDVTAVIDTFMEIEAFLAGITNQETLTGLLQEMKAEIVGILTNSITSHTHSQYLTSHQSLANYVTKGSLNFNDINDSANIYLNAGTVVRRTIITRTKNSQGYVSRVALGLTNPANSFSPAILSVGLNDAGDSWKDFIFYPNGTFEAGAFKKTGGTSSQFLKADGSVDGTEYLASSSYTASDVLAKIKTVDGTGSGLDADLLDGRHSGDFVWLVSGSGIKLNTIGTQASIGSVLGTISTDDGFPSTQIGGYISFGDLNGRPMQIYGTYISNKWYARGSNSVSAGKHTDWREFAFTDSNVASATKLSDNTAFKAWGKTFFENGKPKDVSGDLAIDGKLSAAALEIGDTVLDTNTLAALGGGNYRNDPIYKAAVRSSAIAVTLSTATPAGTYTPPSETQIGMGYSMISIILYHTNYGNVQPYATWGESIDGRWYQNAGPLYDYPAFSGGPVIVHDKSGKLAMVGSSGSGYYIYDPDAATLTPINI